MKYMIGFLSVFFFCGCSKDDTAGSRVFMSEDLVVLGNPSILAEFVGSSEEGPSSFIRIGGHVDSQSGLALTGLKVRVRVLGANGTPLGMREEMCRPAEIAPGGSSTFLLTVVFSADFKESRSIEITPSCDQGMGTLRFISVTWPDS